MAVYLIVNALLQDLEIARRMRAPLIPDEYDAQPSLWYTVRQCH